jgi:hypothetical protein
MVFWFVLVWFLRGGAARCVQCLVVRLEGHCRMQTNQRASPARFTALCCAVPRCAVLCCAVIQASGRATRGYVQRARQHGVTVYAPDDPPEVPQPGTVHIVVVTKAEMQQ